MLNVLKDALKFLFKDFILYNVCRILSVVFPSLKNHPYFAKKISPKISAAVEKAESAIKKMSGVRRALFIMLSIIIINVASYYIGNGTVIIWNQVKYLTISMEERDIYYDKRYLDYDKLVTYVLLDLELLTDELEKISKIDPGFSGMIFYKLVSGNKYKNLRMIGMQTIGIFCIFIAILLFMPAFGVISVLTPIVKAGRIACALYITTVWTAMVSAIAYLKFSSLSFFSVLLLIITFALTVATFKLLYNRGKMKMKKEKKMLNQIRDVIDQINYSKSIDEIEYKDKKSRVRFINLNKALLLALSIVLMLTFAFGTWIALRVSPNNPITISTTAELDNVRNGLNKHYKLNNDIDLTDYLVFGAGFEKWGAEGWEPIGNSENMFTGSFDGNGHRIIGLWINRRNQRHVGLFGETQNSTIKNLGVEIDNNKGGVLGDGEVGGLIGSQNSRNGASIIENCYVTGNVFAISFNAGGIAGCIFSNRGVLTITNCYATGNVTASRETAGGLVGRQSSYINGAVTTAKCYATGDITAISFAGGLVGFQSSEINSANTIENCYAIGNVTTTGTNGRVGGLVGEQHAEIVYRTNINTISNCYATGNVSGSYINGGLVGEQYLADAFDVGNDSSTKTIGDIIMNAISTAGTNIIENCYSTSDVSGGYNTGGLVGRQVKSENKQDKSSKIGTNIITNSYRYAGVKMNGEVLTDNNPKGVHGGIKSSAELTSKKTYAGNSWKFNDSTREAPWYWDSNNFPKLNMGTENFPFTFISIDSY